MLLKACAASNSAWIWFGFWTKAWRKFGIGPLWIQCGPVEQVSELLRAKRADSIEEGGEHTIVVSIELAADRPPSETVQAVLAQIRNVASAHAAKAKK